MIHRPFVLTNVLGVLFYNICIYSSPMDVARVNDLRLALVVRPVTTHPSRDGAPFLLPTEISNVRTLRACLSHNNKKLFFFPSYLLPVWPSVAPIKILGQRLFSRYCLMYHNSPCHTRLFFSPPLAFRFFWNGPHSPIMCGLLSSVLPQGHFCAPPSIPPLVPLFFFALSRGEPPVYL